jgi:hypothetical protein
MTGCRKSKMSLYAFTENNNDPKAKTHFIKYWQILRKFINKAKKQHYSRHISKSNNKLRTACNIIKKEMRKSTFSGAGFNLTFMNNKNKGFKKHGHCLQ